MSTETNKAIVRRSFEQVWNGRRPDLIEEFFAKDYVHHEDMPAGQEGLRLFYEMVLTAFPDFRIAIDEMIAEGDKVAVCSTMTGTHLGDLQGIPPTHKPITHSTVTIYRLATATIVEGRMLADNLNLIRQLGVIPAPEAAEEA